MNWKLVLGAGLLAMNGYSALLGPTAYLQASDSPFSGLAAVGYFHLETFEDGFLNTPGVTASAGSVIRPSTWGTLVDSVDSDDGFIDGRGAGRSFYSGSGPAGIRFTFSAAVLGALPTHAGIVWTDGTNNIRFEAFDQNSVSLGVLTRSHADATFHSSTGEDRFYGVTNAGGISAILIQSGLPGGGGIEVDHLQYGTLADSQSPVPEPGTIGLVAVAGAVAVGLRRRRKA